MDPEDQIERPLQHENPNHANKTSDVVSLRSPSSAQRNSHHMLGPDLYILIGQQRTNSFCSQGIDLPPTKMLKVVMLKRRTPRQQYKQDVFCS